MLGASAELWQCRGVSGCMPVGLFVEWFPFGLVGVLLMALTSIGGSNQQHSHDAPE